MITVHGRVRRGELHLDLDLTIEPGVTFIAGLNGAGKTTLLRLLAGLEALDEGELRLDGQLVDAPAQRRFVAPHHRPIAMAFQDHRLFPHLSVADNVAFPARRRGATRHASRHGALPHLTSLGIGELADRLPAELSVGQRQRTAIARALATPASVLLLDEPLAAIDDDSRPFIRDLLRSAEHPSVVWVTHDPADIDPAAALISVADGRVRQNQIR